MTLDFWIPNAVIPIGSYGINLWVRLSKSAPVTAAADWALLLFALDFAAITAPTEFAQYVAVETLQPNAPAIFVTLMFLGLFAWLGNILHVEPRIEKALKDGWTFKTGGLALASTAGTVAYTYAHLFLFVPRS